MRRIGVVNLERCYQPKEKQMNKITIKQVVQNLTYKNANAYLAENDSKWIWVEENILEPNDLPTTERNVNMIEAKIWELLDKEEREHEIAVELYCTY